MDINEQVALSHKCQELTTEQKDIMVNSGAFNEIIKGYCIAAMKGAGFTDDEIKRVDFYQVFDRISAQDARGFSLQDE